MSILSFCATVLIDLRIVTTEIDTLEQQQTEKIETELNDVDRIRAEHTGVSINVQGVLLGHPIHTISYTIPPLPTAPPGNSQMDSSVQDNPAAPSASQRRES